MTDAPTLPSLRELPVGLRKFHNHSLTSAKLKKTSVVVMGKEINASNSPWNYEFPTCHASRLNVSYEPSTRTLTITIQARNFSDRKQWGEPPHYSSVDTWPHKKQLIYNLHDDLPEGTKQFLLGLI